MLVVTAILTIIRTRSHHGLPLRKRYLRAENREWRHGHRMLRFIVTATLFVVRTAHEKRAARQFNQVRTQAHWLGRTRYRRFCLESNQTLPRRNPWQRQRHQKKHRRQRTRITQRDNRRRQPRPHGYSTDDESRRPIEVSRLNTHVQGIRRTVSEQPRT